MQALRTLLILVLVACAPASGLAQIGGPAQKKTALRMTAYFSEGGDTVPSGVQWRIYEARGTETGDLPEVASSTDSTPTFLLEPGVYIIHAAYGLAAATRRLEVQASPLQEKVVLNAGALKIQGVIGEDPLPAAKLSSRISSLTGKGGRRKIAESIPATDPIRLPEGRYFIENTYGDSTSNAIVTAEIQVKAGQMTEATFHHRAATLTLKLVSQSGGEALANTIWSIETVSGDPIQSSLGGAFPSVILAEGTYTAFARHEDRIYQRDFDVKAGFDQDVELIAK